MLGIFSFKNWVHVCEFFVLALLSFNASASYCPLYGEYRYYNVATVSDAFRICRDEFEKAKDSGCLGWIACAGRGEETVGYTVNNPLTNMGSKSIYSYAPCPEGTILNTETHQCEDLPPVDPNKMLGGSPPPGSGPSPETCNPINFAIGNKRFIETDFRGKGPHPITFVRNYNSLGKAWRFSYLQSVERTSATEVAVHRPDGKVIKFTSEAGGWLADPDVVAELVAVTDGAGSISGWEYVRFDDVHEQYDASGRLVAIVAPNGDAQSVTYATDGKQITVTGENGEWLEIRLDEEGNLPTQLKASDGTTLQYSYSNGMLSTVTYENGTSVQYRYEDSAHPWLITGVIDENGQRSHTVDYDADGLAVASELGGGADRVSVEYADDGSVTLTNALGKRTSYYFETLFGVKKIVRVEGEPSQNCVGASKYYVYDDNGFMISETDWNGITTTYERDAKGRELSRTEAAGTPEARTITTEWDAERRLPLKRTEPSRITVYDYDAQGRLLGTTVQPR